MKLREKLLNKIANKLSNYKTPNYDSIINMDVKGKTKGVLTTYDCTYQEVLKDKEQTGLISVDKLLEDEFKDSKYNSIYFCDKDHTVCLQNHHKHTYVEPVHECFDDAYEVTYLVCDSENGYNNLKFYISQSSKYHTFLEEIDEIPYRKSFEELFSEDDKVDKNESTKNEEVKLLKKNCFEMEGKVVNIGKEFLKKDNSKAQFINIEQEYEFSGKTKINTLSVMLEKDILDNYRDNITVNDVVSIKGTISSYKDKNNNDRIVVNCYELEVLNKIAENSIER